MSANFQDLKLRMAALPADELLDIVTFDVADYRPDALDLAREELYKRGFNDSDLENWRVSAAEQRSNNSVDAKNSGNKMTRNWY